jgi:phage shock protein A
MNPEESLRNLYREWQRLAEIEGDGIRNRNWALVSDCQKALRELQPHIVQQSKAAPKNACQALVAELLELEQRNQQLLEQCRQAAFSQRTQLNQTRANLRRIQRSYSSAPQAGWVSFS